PRLGGAPRRRTAARSAAAPRARPGPAPGRAGAGPPRGGASRRGGPREVVAQHDRLVVLGVPRPEQQRDHPVLRDDVAQPGDRVAVRVELGPVALDELVEEPFLVVEPLPQLGRRRDVLEPQVHVRALLAHAAGPEPVDEHPEPVAVVGGLVHALGPYRHEAMTPRAPADRIRTVPVPRAGLEPATERL